MPKAHILNQRSMEIFADVGVAPGDPGPQHTPGELQGVWLVHGPGRWRPGGRPRPPAGVRRGVGGRLHRSRLHRRQPVRGGQPAADPPGADPQGARRAGPRRPRSASTTSWSTWTQDAEGVTATILDRASGETYRVRSSLPAAAPTVAAPSAISSGSRWAAPPSSARWSWSTSPRTCRSTSTIPRSSSAGSSTRSTRSTSISRSCWWRWARTTGGTGRRSGASRCRSLRTTPSRPTWTS